MVPRYYNNIVVITIIVIILKGQFAPTRRPYGARHYNWWSVRTNYEAPEKSYEGVFVRFRFNYYNPLAIRFRVRNNRIGFGPEKTSLKTHIFEIRLAGTINTRVRNMVPS